MKRYLRLLAATPLALLAGLASAQVAFNDFASDVNSSTYGYNTGAGGTIDGTNGGVGLSEWADQFVSQASGTIQSLTIPMSSLEGSGTVDLTLFTDNGGAIGSTEIETWTMSATGSFGSWSAPAVLAGDGSGSLVSGDAYWLEVATTNAGTSSLFDVWNFSDSTDGPDAVNTGSGWTYGNPEFLSAFEIQVSPEPTTMLALGGMAALAAWRKRRRN